MDNNNKLNIRLESMHFYPILHKKYCNHHYHSKSSGRTG